MTALLTKIGKPLVSRKDAFGNDPFERKRDAEMLCRLISTSTSDPIVISLQSPWGTGKTTFLNRLSAHIEHEQSIPCIVIDAWKTDHSHDPLEAIIAELTLAIEARLPTKKRSPAGKTISVLAEQGSKLLLPVASIALNLVAPASGNVLQAAGTLGERLLRDQKSRRDAEISFKDALQRARDQLTKRAMDRPVKPILLVIDELDRCRPDYAIRMLERIKHYFDVPGITFLIASDRGNLPSAVQTVYGAHVNGEEYLRKFFDYEFHLQPPSRQVFAKHLIQEHLHPQIQDIPKHIFGRDHHGYWETVSSRFEAWDAETADKIEYLVHFPSIADALSLSLRDISQALTIVLAFVNTRSHDRACIPVVDCFIACLRFADPRAFKLLIDSSILHSPGPGAPKEELDLYQKLATTPQWDAIGAFLNRKEPMIMLGGYARPRSSLPAWQELQNSLSKDVISSDSLLNKAHLSIRMRLGNISDPWAYVREFIRLSPPVYAKVAAQTA
ncbi:KAP family P-loop NTPase fold protein [Stenotrophomonas sp. PD6]|uniref:KAP family P-loop NTPase fold protein n=1 Tax=Stenotrophomonas sp. PD6 TaxID=3368612 RepID=UPI003B9F72D7